MVMIERVSPRCEVDDDDDDDYWMMLFNEDHNGTATVAR